MQDYGRLPPFVILMKSVIMKHDRNVNIPAFQYVGNKVPLC